MSRIIVTFKDNEGAFPVSATWKVNGLPYSNVFASEAQAKSYFMLRYGDVVFRRRKK